MVDPFELLRHLANGAIYSGQSLASMYGVSRMTIHHSISKLEDFGIRFDRVPGRGYRLAHPLELLDQGRIWSGLGESCRRYVQCLEVLPHIDSTNSQLLRRALDTAAHGQVCLAECQTAGRGRRGRRWVSPFGRNLYLSLLWRFESCSPELSALSLLIGLAVAEVINRLGVRDIGLKWPNDIVWQGQKLGGILLEMNGELSGRCHVVIGVGINVSMPRVEDRHIEQPWTDMVRLLPDGLPSRNDLAARVIESMVAAVRRFENQGLNGMVQAWRAFDCYYGKAVALHLSTEVKFGTAWGVDPLGRLRLRHGDVEQLYSNGEISLRGRP